MTLTQVDERRDDPIRNHLSVCIERRHLVLVDLPDHDRAIIPAIGMTMLASCER
jgi:hypothetical protein